MDIEGNTADSQLNTRFIAGVRELPDGGFDYSHALTMDDPNGRLGRAVDENAQREKREWLEQLAVPEHVKPGTAYVVWYDLRNAILMNEKAIKENKPGAQQREKLLAQLKMEKAILSSGVITRKLEKRFLEEADKEGKSLSPEQLREKMASVSSAEMADEINGILSGYYASQDSGEEVEFLENGALSRYQLLGDLITASENLLNRLYRESSRTNS
jgi:hypothetical protein